MFLAQHTSGTSWGYGLFIIETLVALGVIALIGYVVVQLSKKRFGIPGKGGGRMRLVERLPLDDKRALHLVEVDGKTFLVGTGEHDVHLLTSVDASGFARTQNDEKGGA